MNLSKVERILAGAVTQSAQITPAQARAMWQGFRILKGFGTSATDLFTAPDHQPKTGKNSLPTYVMHLSPASVARAGFNFCPKATAGCRAACLNTAGRGQMTGVQQGRIARTLFALEHPAEFLALVRAEITRYRNRHTDTGCAIRLNGTSDIRWELVWPDLFVTFPNVLFYDYSKFGDRETPANYHLSYSVSERDQTPAILRAIARQVGRVVAVVDIPAPVGGSDPAPLPTRWWGLPVVDGDATDLRTEAGPVAVLLRSKGAARGIVGTAQGFVKAAQ